DLRLYPVENMVAFRLTCTPFPVQCVDVQSTYDLMISGFTIKMAIQIQNT
ncbi:37822_t:CDS:1, partial [Gigaspora margarita]